MELSHLDTESEKGLFCIGISRPERGRSVHAATSMMIRGRPVWISCPIYAASQLTPHPQAPPCLACGLSWIRKLEPISSVA